MKTWIKQSWVRRPRLSRGWRIVWNVALAALLVVGYWGVSGCPPLTGEGALRRMERTMLLSPGTTLYTEPNGQKAGEKLAFVLGDAYAYVGTVDRVLTVVQADLEYGTRLDRGSVLLPMAGDGFVKQQRREAAFFCPQGPEDGALARLTLTCWCSWETYEFNGYIRGETLETETSVEEFQAQAERDDRGVYRFVVEAREPDGAMALCQLMRGHGYERLEDGRRERACLIDGAEYRLEFLRADGSLAGTARGELAPWDWLGQKTRPTRMP